MTRNYRWYDWVLISGLTILALPSPEDAATLGASNIIGIAGLVTLYPDFLSDFGHAIIGK